jgi:hypothetical protein
MFSHIRSRQENLVRGEVETFDITLFDAQDQVLAEIEGFTMRRIGDPAKAPEENVWARDAVRTGGEQPIETAGRAGIPPVSGAQALTRILLTLTPHAVVAVSQPLENLDTRKVTPSTREIGVSTSNTTPQSKGVEGTLASWWQDMLGTEHVGLDDDFFALGGH